MRVSILSEPAPIAGRQNEDACMVWSDGKTSVAAVIDGATQRLPLPELYAPDDASVTGARVAAQITQETLQTVAAQGLRDPAAMLLAANRQLRTRLERVAALDADAFAALAPQHAALLADDPRLMRLMLPVCVATVLSVDRVAQTAHFAHAGDTALFVFYTDGRIERLTADQMAPHDAAALETAITLKAQLPAQRLTDVLRHETVRRVNLANGVYHNYVDLDGATDPAVGVGVINGLPTLRAYIQTGTFDLADVVGLLLCSDGFMLPAPLHEAPDQTQHRLRTMRDVLFAEGIEQYYAQLRTVEAHDMHCNRYPRFKPHDDASAVFLELR